MDLKINGNVNSNHVIIAKRDIEYRPLGKIPNLVSKLPLSIVTYLGLNIFGIACLGSFLFSVHLKR